MLARARIIIAFFSLRTLSVCLASCLRDVSLLVSHGTHKRHPHYVCSFIKRQLYSSKAEEIQEQLFLGLGDSSYQFYFVYKTLEWDEKVKIKQTIIGLML